MSQSPTALRLSSEAGIAHLTTGLLGEPERLRHCPPGVLGPMDIGQCHNQGWFPLRQLKFFKGQRSCELQAIRSCPDKEGKLASPPCLGLSPGLSPQATFPCLGFCAFKRLSQGPDPFLLERHPSRRLDWGRASCFTFSRKCRGCWLALAPTPGPLFSTSHSSSNQVWFSGFGSLPPGELSPGGVTGKQPGS